MLYTWIINISGGIKPSKWEYLLNHIDIDRKNSISKFRFLVDQKRSLIAGLLIKAMINELYPNKDMKLSYGKNYYGKPFNKEVPEIFFNISHSGEYVCCAISDSEVGVDIEEINPFMEIDSFKDFFTKEEWIQVLDEKNNSHDMFFSLWTLKESYIKKIGTGLSKELNSFSIFLDNQIRVVDSQIEKRNTHFLLYDIGSSYKMAICSEKRVDNGKQELSIQEFLDRFY
ncbi:4'-phosphopantetheinyl transferase family protein [Listeria ivanovii]|nr:4'-phosphopantetheinyl transferase superfamily protein [Listeria ivanovii]